jgi:exonuclease VII large subunit
MVAHTWLKTPTAVADFFVGLFVEQEQYIMYLFQRISLTLTQKISAERQKLALLHNGMVQGAANLVSNGRRSLDMLQLRINAANPAKILGNGFAIVAVDGKRASVEDIREGCRVRMVLADGTVEFTVGEVSSVEKRMEQ